MLMSYARHTRKLISAKWCSIWQIANFNSCEIKRVYSLSVCCLMSLLTGVASVWFLRPAIIRPDNSAILYDHCSVLKVTQKQPSTLECGLEDELNFVKVLKVALLCVLSWNLVFTPSTRKLKKILKSQLRNVSQTCDYRLYVVIVHEILSSWSFSECTWSLKLRFS